MTLKNAIIYGSAALTLAAFGFYFYEKQRVKKLDERVVTLEEALATLQNVK
jgi:hypothetical protein